MNPIRSARALAKAHPFATDAVAASLLTAFAMLSLNANSSIPNVTDSTAPFEAWVALTLCVTLPMALRRRFPVAALAITLSALIAHRLEGVPEVAATSAATLFAMYAVAVFGRPRRRVIAGGVGFAAVVALSLWSVVVEASQLPGNVVLIQVFNVVLNVAFLGTAWLIGDYAHTNAGIRASLEERTIQLEHEREANTKRAIVSERVRIARELHDVVAHHVSVMGVQAGAARTVLESDPDRATAALSSIEQTSRTAVHEMQRMLGMLRQDGDLDELTPMSSMAHVDSLLDATRESGITIGMSELGERGELTPMIDLTLYRIIQESLTNVRKHAGRAAVTIAVDYQPDTVGVVIRDDGYGAAADIAPAGGRGLAGMAERVQLAGGEFAAGPAAGGGYRVEATLPRART